MSSADATKAEVREEKPRVTKHGRRKGHKPQFQAVHEDEELELVRPPTSHEGADVACNALLECDFDLTPRSNGGWDEVSPNFADADLTIGKENVKRNRVVSQPSAPLKDVQQRIKRSPKRAPVLWQRSRYMMDRKPSTSPSSQEILGTLQFRDVRADKSAQQKVMPFWRDPAQTSPPPRSTERQPSASPPAPGAKTAWYPAPRTRDAYLNGIRPLQVVPGREDGRMLPIRKLVQSLDPASQSMAMTPLRRRCASDDHQGLRVATDFVNLSRDETTDLLEKMRQYPTDLGSLVSANSVVNGGGTPRRTIHTSGSQTARLHRPAPHLKPLFSVGDAEPLESMVLPATSQEAMLGGRGAKSPPRTAAPSYSHSPRAPPRPKKIVTRQPSQSKSQPSFRLRLSKNPVNDLASRADAHSSWPIIMDLDARRGFLTERLKL